MDRLLCFLCLAALAATLGGNAGCSRQFYRTKADREVYSVIRQGNNDPRWRIDDYNIKPDATSRLYNPFNPDGEPMPEDDPAAHRKMHRVAGMKGAPDWHNNGDTRYVENPYWRQYLLVNERGEIPLDKDKAVELSILHSPEYQAARENLYLAAMGVAQGRYEFDIRFFGGDSVSYRNAGGSGASWRNTATAGAERTLATGATWVVDLANSITWTLSGTGSWNAGTTFNVGVVQPLLRGAGRKVVLENLTQEERDFLATVRQMILYQQGHYTRIVTGSGRQNIPSGASTAGSTPNTGSFYGLLEQQIQIQNQRQNIIGMEDNLNRFIELFDAGQVSNVYQIRNMEQNLLSSQRDLLRLANSYQSDVETYIRSLGLPPDLKVSITDPLLEQFQLTSPTLTALQEDVSILMAAIRKRDQPLPENFRDELKTIIRRTEGEIAVLEQDLEILQKSMPDRIAGLKSLEAFITDRIADGERVDLDPSVYDTETFLTRVNKLQTEEIPNTLARLQATFTLLNLIVDFDEPTLREMMQNRSFAPSVQEALRLLKLSEIAESTVDPEQSTLATLQQELERLADELRTLRGENGDEAAPRVIHEDAERIIAELRLENTYRDWVRRVCSVYQNELVTLSLMQTRARLDAMTLAPVSVTPEEAFQIASEHRLDWMNRKAQLVDTWRKIDIAADRLRGAMSLTFDGTLGTSDKYGVQFSKNNSDLALGLRWDTPLDRYDEMLAYRRSQIAYQNARRAYYTYVDSVQAQLRNTLRDVQLSQINFEINRNAIFVDTVRVDVMQLQMERPPTRGASIDTNTSEQLVNALNGLMRSQNSFLSTWIAYQTQRMLLDMYMGTMELDERGRWIDPGVIGSEAAVFQRHAPVLIPVPIPVPMIETPRVNRRYVE